MKNALKRLLLRQEGKEGGEIHVRDQAALGNTSNDNLFFLHANFYFFFKIHLLMRKSVKTGADRTNVL